MALAEIGDFYTIGNNHLREAISHDNQGAAALALKSYVLATTYLIKACDHEKDGNLKQKLEKKIEETLTRCETLKKYLQTNPESPHPGREWAEPAPVLKPAGNLSGTPSGTSSGSNTPHKNSFFIREKPNVSWDDVIGLEQAKQTICESFEMPRKFPDLYKGKREPWSGMLLYGPPGTGKTLLVKAMATQLKAEFMNVKTADIISKFQGDSEKQIKSLFEEARRRATEVVVIIFMDEIDSLCLDRSLGSAGGDSAASSNVRLLAQILMEMDGIDSKNTNLFVVGATNLPWLLDAGVLRRFPKRLYIPLPNIEARKQILLHNLSLNHHLLSEKDFEEIAERTQGYSGSDLTTLTKEAIMAPIKDIMKATEFFKNPTNDKFVPVLRQEDKRYLIEFYGDLFVQKYQQQPHFVPFKWQELTNETVDTDIPVTRTHLLESFARVKPVTNLDALAKYTEWTRDHADAELL